MRRASLARLPVHILRVEAASSAGWSVLRAGDASLGEAVGALALAGVATGGVTGRVTRHATSHDGEQRDDDHGCRRERPRPLPPGPAPGPFPSPDPAPLGGTGPNEAGTAAYGPCGVSEIVGTARLVAQHVRPSSGTVPHVVRVDGVVDALAASV